ncbi:hypothetical protein [Olivibacter sitiensis]|uniref:hypothetical protein n=1 Tax=Olivibacter sitiensis TaxID=376470 RepID=UPI0003FEAA41|nr:hypothetical protein [Olivibacter sitiensis]
MNSKKINYNNLIVMKKIDVQRMEALVGGRDKWGEFKEGLCWGTIIGFGVIGFASFSVGVARAFNVASITAGAICAS